MIFRVITQKFTLQKREEEKEKRTIYRERERTIKISPILSDIAQRWLERYTVHSSG